MKKWKENERQRQIAKELSDLVVYCRPVQFSEDKANDRVASMSIHFGRDCFTGNCLQSTPVNRTRFVPVINVRLAKLSN